MTMKFALIRPWEFDAIYFETEELAIEAQKQINTFLGSHAKTMIIRVGNDVVISDIIQISAPVVISDIIQISAPEEVHPIPTMDEVTDVESMTIKPKGRAKSRG